MPATSQAIDLPQVLHSDQDPSHIAIPSTSETQQMPREDASHTEDTSSVASSQATNLTNPHRLLKILSGRVRDSRYQYFQVSIGLVTLVFGSVSFIFYTNRSYKLALWTAHNDLIQTCADLAQAQPDKAPDARCARLLAEGPPDPPYSRQKRYESDARFNGFRNEIRYQGDPKPLFGAVKSTGSYSPPFISYGIDDDEATLQASPDIRTFNNGEIYAVLGIIFPLLVFCGVFINCMRRKSGKGESFTSLVRSEIRAIEDSYSAGERHYASQFTTHTWQQISEVCSETWEMTDANQSYHTEHTMTPEVDGKVMWVPTSNDSLGATHTWQQISSGRNGIRKLIHTNQSDDSDNTMSLEVNNQVIWAQPSNGSLSGLQKDSSSGSEVTGLIEQHLETESDDEPSGSRHISLDAKYALQRATMSNFGSAPPQPEHSAWQRGRPVKRAEEVVRELEWHSENGTVDTEDYWRSRGASSTGIATTKSNFMDQAVKTDIAELAQERLRRTPMNFDSETSKSREDRLRDTDAGRMTSGRVEQGIVRSRADARKKLNGPNTFFGAAKKTKTQSSKRGWAWRLLRSKRE